MDNEARRSRIQQAVDAWERKQGIKETLVLPWRTGQNNVFPVVEIELSVPLLNAKSHRLRSELESHPRGRTALNDPWSDEAQSVITELLRKPSDAFDRLKESLLQEGQRQPGVITRDGVLMNANRRAVALRDVSAPHLQWIRVAVLPSDAQPSELVELELGLQLQEELKTEYSLTNEMLFIEDLAREYHMSVEQIAIHLRWANNNNAGSIKRGVAEVAQRRRILALIREMQTFTNPMIPLTFFDGKLEQLRALEERYNALMQEDPLSAKSFREAWLATALTGTSSVHDLRAVYDESFVEDYLLPKLTDPDLVPAQIGTLLDAAPAQALVPSGVEDLASGDLDDEASDNDSVNLRGLIDVLATPASAPTVVVGEQAFDPVQLRNSIHRATRQALDDWRADQRSEDRLDSPTAHLKQASKHIKKAIEKYKELKGQEVFERSRRGDFNYQLKHLHKLVKQIDEVDNRQNSTEM